MLPQVSIIIPCKIVDATVEEAVEGCLALDYPNFEILVLPDSPSDLKSENVRLIPTGPVKPSVKRNTGIANSQGEICAFLDSDAFPRKDWLKNAVKYLENPDFAAVGGPGIMLEEGKLKRKASGIILSSPMGGAGLAFRYKPTKSRETDDLPSCNFIARRSILEKLGGFEADFWPGEDTALCLKITHRLKKKIMYHPDIVVYHRRRPLFIPYLKQIWSYGLHRGYFAKKFPETSRKFPYFVPSVFLIGFILGLILSMINPTIKIAFLAVMALYLLSCFLTGLKTKNLKLTALVFLGIILTHFFYGTAYLIGLSIRELKG